MKKSIFVLSFSLVSLLSMAQMPDTSTNDSSTKDSLKVTGNISVDGYLLTKHIKSPDGTVHIGDSSMTWTSLTAQTNTVTGVNTATMEFQSTNSYTSGGMGLGWGTNYALGLKSMSFGTNARAYGLNSIAFGTSGQTVTDADYSMAFGWSTKVSSSADHAIVMGSGFSSTPMLNSTAQSLAVGFNSNVATFFVSSGNGTSGSLGKVGIGTTTLNARLSVNGDGLFTNVTGTPTYAPYIKGSSNVTTAGAPDYTWYGDLTTGIFHPAASVIAFSKAGTETMRIHSTGFVGIGQTNPVTANLEILNSGGGYIFRAGMGSTNPSLDIWQTSSTSGTGKRTSFLFYGGGFELFDQSANSGAGASRLWISPTDGKVGIGTVTPAAQLDVNVPSSVTTAFNLQNTTLAKSVFLVNTADGATHIGSQTQNSGGSHTDALLTVNGKGVAKSFYVTNVNWSDFVFDANYKLMSPYEVESYYKENHHLPNVPSAKEIKEKGNNLGETDAILLQKIEENTLYIVDLKKQLDAQQEVIAELKKQNELLSEKVLGKK